MRTLFLALFISAVICAPLSANADIRELKPLDVMQKVQKAARLLSEDTEAGLTIIRDKSSEFFWNGTYVFVVDCDADRVMANPAFPEREGGDIKQHTDYNGKQYGLELCDVAKRPEGGWIEYVWLRPGGEVPTRKVSYVMSTRDSKLQLGAGLYDTRHSLDSLRQLAGYLIEGRHSDFVQKR